MSCGRYAEDFDIPVRAPKWRQGHVSVRKLVQSYNVDVLTCGTIVSTRELKQTTTTTATRTAPNERFDEQNNSCARAL